REGLGTPHPLANQKQENTDTGSLGSDPIGNEDLLLLPVDVLVPAARGGVITEANVRDIRAGLILEAANAPTTPKADEVLAQRGVTVLPDIYVNAAGVTVSYFEWAQN